MKTNKKIDYLNEVRESLYLKSKQIDSRQVELSNVLSIISPNSNGDVPDYYFVIFADLVNILNSEDYSFDIALKNFNSIVSREVGENKNYWNAANSLRKCTLHGEEFFDSLRMYSIIYPQEGNYVRKLEANNNLNNGVKRSTR